MPSQQGTWFFAFLIRSERQMMDLHEGGAMAPRKSYARIRDVYELPRLIEVQLDSFRWFQTEGLEELFNEISPIVSFNKNLELHFGSKPGPDGFWFGNPKYSELECRDRDITFAAPLWVRVRLVNRETGEVAAQHVFLGDFPLMTDNGTFIINGAERVVVSQLIRSPGVYFTVEEDRVTDRRLCYAKLIPSRGAWLEFETSKRDLISVKVDRKRKLPVTVLLRAIGYGSDDQILELFSGVDNEPEHAYIAFTLERDPTRTPNGSDADKGVEAALLEFYKKLRPGDPPTLDNAKSFMQNLIFAPRRYDRRVTTTKEELLHDSCITYTAGQQSQTAAQGIGRLAVSSHVSPADAVRRFRVHRLHCNPASAGR
jgi:DNA-directed RNA polymerase subunit beta